MATLTPEGLGEYRLTKITYNHTLKELELFISSFDPETKAFLKPAKHRIHTSIRRRNMLVDWIWAPIEEIENYLQTLDEREIRYKTTDHTTTYYRTPEKLSALRKEVDEFIGERIDTDFILDRIGLVGIENISKIEKYILEKESKV